ncbi:MAG: hypothetical protein H0W97_08155 [Actinobacteria bacterium]|nr:hypothetical protein [Actinomycetota bacterium]
MNEELYFGVSIETWGSGPNAVDDERLGALGWALGELGAAGPAVGSGGLAGGPGATFGIYVPEEPAHPKVWTAVTQRAVAIFEDACTKAGIAHDGIAHVEILTEEYFDREVEQEPETYLGVSEVARELGVSRQRVAELRRSEAFPAPIADIAAGPVWKGSSLTRFIEGWERRPGRPRKRPHPAPAGSGVDRAALRWRGR